MVDNPTTYEEKRFRSIFQHSAVSLWEQDISSLRVAIDLLRVGGVVDMPKYLQEHPEFLQKAAQMINVIDVNEATLALYEVADRGKLLGPLDRTLDLEDPQTLESLRDEILLVASGGTRLEREFRATTPSGKKFDLLVSLSVPSPNDVYPHMLVNALDITQRKRAEEELHKSRQLLQIVLDHVPQRVFWKDTDFRYLGCNNAFAEDVGLADAGSIVGKDDFDLPWHMDAQDYRVDDAKVITTGVPKLNYERLRRRGDGTVQRIRGSRVPLRDRDGEVVGVLGTYDDISVEMKAQEELRESERHYHDMFLAAQRKTNELELLNKVRTAVMLELEPPEVIRTVVEGVASIFGYKHVSAYLLRGDILELQHQVGYETPLHKISVSEGVSGRTVQTGLPILIEDVQKDPDFLGAISDVHSEVCIPLIDQGRVLGVLNVESTKETILGEADLGLMTALGEYVSIAFARARLYADVRQSEERYRTLVENLGEGITIVDPTETILFANAAAEKVFGVSPGSLAGQNLQRFLSDEDYKHVLMETEKRRRGETSTFEQQIMQPDGSVRWILLTATPQFYQAGGFSHTLGIFRDITESKKSEQALRESEERFRQLGEAALEGIAITEKGLVYDGNSRLAKMLGYELSEMIGKPVSNFIAPDSRAVVAEHISKNYMEQYEHSLRRKDGSTLPVESRARMINWEGRPMRVTALHDISERIRSQEQLQKLSLAVSQSPASIVITDVRGNIEYVNPKFTELTGYSLEEALGQNPRILKTGETTPEEYERLWETITHGGEWRGEFRNKKKNGDLYWELASISPVKNAANAIAYFVAVKEDITDRKRAEEQLVVSEERYRRLFEDSPIGIAFLGTQREIILTNQRYRDFLGLSEAEIIKRGPIGILHPDDWEASMALSEKLRSGEIPVFHMEQRYLRGDAAVVWADTSIVALRDKDGRVIQTIGWVQDITGRKREEEEKAKLQGQLVQAQKMELVGRLAGGVAHDFNNMLNVILGHSQLALERTDPGHPLYEGLTEIHKAAERSAGLTNQLLAFARKQTVAPKVLDLNETVEGMLKMLERLIGEDVHLSWQPKGGLWRVRLDPSQISQILANLCANARDAITDVGKITIETENITFDESYCVVHPGFLPGQYVLLAVSDDGSGMDKETLSHIFESFFTTKGIGKGTGLGLATIYGIVKQNNGFVNVYSEPGHGTSIKLYLPRHVGKQQAPAKGTAKAFVRGRATILLVEDEPAILTLTATMLENQGYTVLMAGTPGEAMRLAREHTGQIDLLITDVIMPEMNGRDLAKNLLALYPYLKRLFTSGYTANVIAHHGVLDEGVHFLQKPFSADELAAKVEEALERS